MKLTRKIHIKRRQWAVSTGVATTPQHICGRSSLLHAGWSCPRRRRSNLISLMHSGTVKIWLWTVNVAKKEVFLAGRSLCAVVELNDPWLRFVYHGRRHFLPFFFSCCQYLNQFLTLQQWHLRLADWSSRWSEHLHPSSWCQGTFLFGRRREKWEKW